MFFGFGAGEQVGAIAFERQARRLRPLAPDFAAFPRQVQHRPWWLAGDQGLAEVAYRGAQWRGAALEHLDLEAAFGGGIGVGGRGFRRRRLTDHYSYCPLVPALRVGIHPVTLRVTQCLLHRRRLDDLDPISIRVLDERQALHAAIRQALLEVTAQGFEAFARRDNVRHRDADMAKATRVGVAVVVGKVGIVFGAVVG